MYYKKLFLVSALASLMGLLIGFSSSYKIPPKKQPTTYQSQSARMTPLWLLPTPTVPVEPIITSIPVQSGISHWAEYKDEKNGVVYKYPPEYSITEPLLYENRRPILNHKIDWWTTSQIECDDAKGDCSLVANKKEKMIINGYETTRISGWSGSVGGGLPENYVSYYFKNPSKNNYLNITLHEIPLDDTDNYSYERSLKPIPQSEIDVFDKIVNTVQFVDILQ